MDFNPKDFKKSSLIDSCSVWNLLSSKRLFEISQQATATYCASGFVRYECLKKARKSVSESETELIKRLNKAIEEEQFTFFSTHIEDLHDLEILEKRKHLGLGELSSLVLARRFNIAFTTDDKGARKFGEEILPKGMVQTIPQLFGWLVYNQLILDHEKDEIIAEHVEMGRPLKDYFQKMFELILQYKLNENRV